LKESFFFFKPTATPYIYIITKRKTKEEGGHKPKPSQIKKRSKTGDKSQTQIRDKKKEK